MKILFVCPYVRGIWGGNRIHTYLSSYISQSYHVDNLIYEIYEGTIEQYTKALGNGSIIIMKKRKDNKFYFPYSLKYLYGGIVDIILAKKIKQLFCINRYNAIIVISSSEGWWLGFLLKKLKRTFPVILCVQQTDPPLGIELEFYESKKSKNAARNLINKLFVKFQKLRLKNFDIVFGLSRWSNSIMEKFFGIKPEVSSGALDLDYMNPLNVKREKFENYIAVPTVALDAERKNIIKKLYENGINLKLYGTVEIEGVPSNGFISDYDMINIIGNGNALLFLFDYEGLGLIPIESLGIGTPVITEKKQGPGMELTDNQYVAFVESNDEIIEACRKALNKTLTLPERMKIHETVKTYSFSDFSNRIMRALEEQWSHLQESKSSNGS